jgi:uncharacterized protein
MVPVEPVTPLTPRPVGRAVLRQDWLTLTFLHWAVDPARVAPLLPAGVRPDVLDGRTYVGLVPFLMHDVAGPLGPPVPYAGTFCETNVRVYSVDAGGRRGVVFLSLDASRLAPVLTARWAFGMPYLWSRMSLRRDGDRLAYRCRRLWPGGPGVGATRSAVDVRVGGPVEPGPVEHFLTARCWPPPASPTWRHAHRTAPCTPPACRPPSARTSRLPCRDHARRVGP